MDARKISLAAFFLILIFCGSVLGQTSPVCTTSAQARPTHAEGIAELQSTIALSCTGGTPGSTINATIFVTLNTTVTNRVSTKGDLLGMVTTVDTGAGPVPVTLIPSLINPMALSFNGVPFTVPTGGGPVTIALSGIRANQTAAPNVTGGPVGTIVPTVTATVFAGASGVQLGSGTVTLSGGLPTLLSSVINNGVPCAGSPLPTATDFASFRAATSSSTVRLTEASLPSFTAVEPGGDSGVRFIVNYTGYGTTSRLFVPDAVVGSTGTQATSDGSFGLTAAPGTYTPMMGQLLLIRVNGADANGAGGMLAMPVPVTQTAFSTTTELVGTKGSFYAVYEVVDSSAAIAETAQIPAFVVSPAYSCAAPLATTVGAMLAPVSKSAVSDMVSPVPRFVGAVPASDCTMNGDCKNAYYPALSVMPAFLTLTGNSLGSAQTTQFQVFDAGAGVLNFTASVAYQNGANWLALSTLSGVTPTLITVTGNPAALAPGTYVANVTINAGAYGTTTFPVTFTVGPVQVMLTNVGNAASFVYGSVAPGSYTVVYGSNLMGKSVGVTIGGLPANVIFNNGSQINLVVPAGLGPQASAPVVATVDGNVSNAFNVSVVPNAPGIFTPGVINFDTSAVNTAGQPVTRGAIISVYLTGLSIPLTGAVTVNIGGLGGLTPLYAGAQPTLTALDQVNILVPATLPAAGAVPLQICIPGPSGAPVCSNTVNLYVQ